MPSRESRNPTTRQVPSNVGTPRGGSPATMQRPHPCERVGLSCWRATWQAASRQTICPKLSPGSSKGAACGRSQPAPLWERGVVHGDTHRPHVQVAPAIMICAEQSQHQQHYADGEHACCAA